MVKLNKFIMYGYKPFFSYEYDEDDEFEIFVPTQDDFREGLVSVDDYEMTASHAKDARTMNITNIWKVDDIDYYREMLNGNDFDLIKYNE